MYIRMYVCLYIRMQCLCGGFLLGHFVVGLVCLFLPFGSIILGLWLVHLSAELQSKSYFGEVQIFMSRHVRSNKIKKHKLGFIKGIFTYVCGSLAD